MKIPSKPFAELATRYKSDDFFRARARLTLLYTLVMTIVLALFSVFLFVRVEQQLVKISARNDSSQFISKETAVAIAESQNPTARITDIDEELLNDTLVYVVELYQNAREEDIYIDRITGEVLTSVVDGVEVETINDVLINDFEENLLLANAGVLLLTIFLSYFLAGATLRPIQKKMKQQEQFSLDVAHEIRTPLSAIIAATDSVLVKEETTRMYQETLRDIRHEAKRLSGLTEDLLATARNIHSTECTKVHMGEVITTVLSRLAKQAREKSVQLDLLKEQPCTTFGNKIMLERMIENVVHNAIKFSHEGGVVKIIVRDKVISILDTGIGMTPEQKAHVFERFYTADSARNEYIIGPTQTSAIRGVQGKGDEVYAEYSEEHFTQDNEEVCRLRRSYNKNGVGLGLAIVRQIADFHKISIHIESEQGRGTSIQFSFLQ